MIEPVLLDEPAKTHASKDRDAVNNIKMLLVGGLINPFTSSSSEFLNIATGEKCASLNILEAKEKGQETLSRAAHFAQEVTETSQIIESKDIPGREQCWPESPLSL